MDTKNFSLQMSGLWISQSTNYSLLQKQEKVPNTFTNKIKWTIIPSDKECFKWIKANLRKEDCKNLICLHRVNFSNSQSNYRLYYITLFQDKFDQIHLIKFDKSLHFINKFTIQVLNSNYIYLTSTIDKFTLSERIFFLNDKVKLIKSVIKKQKKYVATYFSSEIKIS